MTFEDEWTANEDCLVQEADSLGALLERLRGVFSPSLVGDPEWEILAAHTRSLPPTLAGFPLWLGVPVDRSRAAVCLDLSLLGNTRSAEVVTRNSVATGSDSPTGIAASILERTGARDSRLRKVVGDRVLLHYRIDAAKRSRAPFESRALLYPAGPRLSGDDSVRQFPDFRMTLDAMNEAAFREPDEDEHRQLERVFFAMEPGVRIGAIGASPSAEDALRLTVLGFSGTETAFAFMDRAGWRGRKSPVKAALMRLESRGALGGMQLGVQLDITAAGVKPSLELQIYSASTIHDETGWFKDKRCWNQLMDGLSQGRLAVSEKLQELRQWSFAAKPFFGRSGPLLLLQRIHHFSVIVDGEGASRIHAHVFLLLSRWPRRANAV